MTGTKTTQKPEVVGSPDHFLATHWIPRTIRCKNCGALAREEVRERVSDDEIVVRYECAYCCQPQTRHYLESELGVSK